MSRRIDTRVTNMNAQKGLSPRRREGSDTGDDFDLETLSSLNHTSVKGDRRAYVVDELILGTFFLDTRLDPPVVRVLGG